MIYFTYIMEYFDPIRTDGGGKEIQIKRKSGRVGILHMGRKRTDFGLRI